MASSFAPAASFPRPSRALVRVAAGGMAGLIVIGRHGCFHRRDQNHRGRGEHEEEPTARSRTWWDLGMDLYGVAVARWEGPWRGVGVAAAIGDDAGGMESREDRGDSRGRAAAGAVGLKYTVASFLSVPFCFLSPIWL